MFLLDITMSFTETDEPIEMPSGMWTRVGPRDHVLGGTPNPQAILGAFTAMRPFAKIL